MPYRTRRQSRYERLRKCGFVGFEARALSRVSIRVPYMMPLMKKRLEEYGRAKKRAQRQGLSEVDFSRQWLTFIKRRYIMKKWRHGHETWDVTVGFRMLKEAERQFKYKRPQYDSPWEKRQKQWRDFEAKIDREYEKYPKGKAYGKRTSPPKMRYLPEGGAEYEE